MRHRVRLLLLAFSWLALFPAAAFAHVVLKRSDPGARSIVSTPPLQLRFWFSEPVELALTQFTLTDAQGKSVGLGDPTAGGTERGQSEVHVQLLSPLSAGSYTVTYKTVALDGHPAAGKFTFTVLGATEAVDTAFANAALRAQKESATVAARGLQAEKPIDVLQVSSTDPVYVIIRALSFALLVLVVGAPLFWLVVLRPAAGADSGAWKPIEARVASLGSLAALGFVLVGLVRLVLQTRVVSGNEMPDVGDIAHLVTRTNWGFYWNIQMASALVLACSLLLRRTLKRVGWYVAAASALALALGTSATSHAGASDAMRGFGIMDDSTHILAVSAWIGGLFWLVTAALPTFDADRKSKRLAALVNGFSRSALISAGLVVFTGVVSARLRVGSLHNLVSSSYGQAILLKLALVLVVAGIGMYNWRVVRPSLEGTGEGTVDTLRRTGRGELAVSLLVIAVTAVLVALPLPAGS